MRWRVYGLDVEFAQEIQRIDRGGDKGRTDKQFADVLLKGFSKVLKELSKEDRILFWQVIGTTRINEFSVKRFMAHIEGFRKRNSVQNLAKQLDLGFSFRTYDRLNGFQELVHMMLDNHWPGVVLDKSVPIDGIKYNTPFMAYAHDLEGHFLMLENRLVTAEQKAAALKALRSLQDPIDRKVLYVLLFHSLHEKTHDTFAWLINGQALDENTRRFLLTRIQINLEGPGRFEDYMDFETFNSRFEAIYKQFLKSKK